MTGVKMEKKVAKVVLDMGAYKSRSEALEIVNRAEKAGVRAEIPCKSGGMYYVRSARIPKDDAQKVIEALAEKKIDAVIYK